MNIFRCICVNCNLSLVGGGGGGERGTFKQGGGTGEQVERIDLEIMLFKRMMYRSYHNEHTKVVFKVLHH